MSLSLEWRSMKPSRFTELIFIRANTQGPDQTPGVSAGHKPRLRSFIDLRLNPCSVL